jgi:hypothetical protein
MNGGVIAPMIVIKVGDVIVTKITQAEKERKAWHKALLNDPVRLEAFMRKVLGPPRRRITGVEYDHMMSLFALVKPDRESNNQRTWTDEYSVCGKNYHVTFGLEDNPIIEEIENV